MSANDVLDVLNIQRDSQQDQQKPPRKRQRSDGPPPPKLSSGMARELYSLLGPNTPPVALPGATYGASSGGIKDKMNTKPSPWSKMPFQPLGKGPKYYHWVRGSRELLEQDTRPYSFDKFNTKLSLPTLMPEDEYIKLLPQFREHEIAEMKKLAAEKRRAKEREVERQKEREEKQKKKIQADKKTQNGVLAGQLAGLAGLASTAAAEASDTSTKKTPSEASVSEKTSPAEETGANPTTETSVEIEEEPIEDPVEWSYEETEHLFDICAAFDLKWNVIVDRFKYRGRTMEDMKEHYYRVCYEVLKNDPNANPSLLESLDSFSKTKEVERKQYLENLLTRTPAEIAEEESLVIEARRFELAAKKMLSERLYLLNLLDLPQSSQSVLQYQSSQGLANLYSNLMILDKHQKKRQQLQVAKSQGSVDPIPPPIPMAASSSVRKDRNFQTHLQSYLAGLVKQNQSNSGSKEPNSIQQLLAKRLTTKEEEAYGLHYHANDKLNPGVTLRSQQRLPGLQQRQSVLKSVNNLFQELEIPTSGGTNWKPTMPTRKTMAKYDQLLRSVVALLEVKKGKDKLEAEITLIKEQRDIK